MGRRAGNRDAWWGKKRESTVTPLVGVEQLLLAEPRIPFDPVVLFQDAELIVVDKPAFLPTTPNGRLQANTVQQRVRMLFDDDAIVAIHRLDRLTSGVMVLSRNPETRGAYQQLFQSGKVDKTYQCLTVMPDDWAVGEQRTVSVGIVNVDGERGVRVAPAGEGTLATSIVRFDGPVAANIGDCLPGFHGSSCSCASCGQVMTVATWTVKPLTGRTHQIRATMNYLGYPILGDDTYPDDLGLSLTDFSRTLRLLATSLSFDDPVLREDVGGQRQQAAEVTGTRRTFESSLRVNELI